MPPVTIKRAIVETLEDLKKEDFDKFCAQLRDRREEPRVSYRAVEGKTPWQIADVLVSNFTEEKALLVTLELLRQIKCNEEAKTLESKTSTCVCKGDSTLHRRLTRELNLKTPEEALKHAPHHPLQAAGQGGPRKRKLTAEEKACVFSDGGNPGRERLRFGKYKGKTFKWLLKNDAAHIVASHRMEKESTLQQGRWTANKDSLTKYAEAYPKVMEEVKFKCAGEAPVGFGKNKKELLKNLYESKDEDKISYVDYLRTMKSTCTEGSRMEKAIQYILWRDQGPYPNYQRTAKTDHKVKEEPPMRQRQGQQRL
ncbi:uncharacterized protein LOC119496737 isoform X2 [Xyrichtys novacula]|uniref:Uncharacterized protein LOC119496737 isoform X2 n=1 Tax=Xyrichtys novacula TaxID=13765 RepID=A0AAV1FNZ9_XYRNO|nr:uncharacterized protein LOC119496737 isoform X2 [Xyrichtys novacula]